MDIKAIVSATITVSDLSPKHCSIACSFLHVKPTADGRNKLSYCSAFMAPGDSCVTSLARELEREPACIRVFGLDNRNNFEIGEQTTIPLAPVKPKDAVPVTEPANEQDLELIPDPFLFPENVATEAETETDPASATDNDIEEAITAVVDRDDPVNWKKNDGWKRYEANNPPPIYEFADVYGVRFGRWGFGTEREVVKKVKVMACDDSIRDLLKIGAGVGYGAIAGSDDNITIISWRPHVPRGRKAGRNAKPEELR